MVPWGLDIWHGFNGAGVVVRLQWVRFCSDGSMGARSVAFVQWGKFYSESSMGQVL